MPARAMSIRALLMAVLLAASAGASGDVTLEEITVTATRIPVSWSRAPLALSRVDGAAVQAARQQLGLDEALTRVPGLFFQNRYNFAQDLRISIRGFGARANFGIRGLRLFADGIPLTMPDGQGNVDSIDLGSVERIEVIRGPVSAMYGAAGGGAILLYSEPGPEEAFASARLNAGAYGFREARAEAGGQAGAFNGIASLVRTELDGYRDFSEYERTLFNSRLRYAVSERSALTVVFNAVDSPQAQDPGALNSGEVGADRRQAAPRNVLFDAGEALEQQKLGVTWESDLGANQGLVLRAYVIRRDFSNKLPFDINSNGQGGSVDLDRDVRGVGGHWSLESDLGGGRANRLVIGFEYDEQLDLRRRFANNEGVIGALTTKQDEDVIARGVFIENAYDVTPAWTLSLGARFDDLEYRVRDRTGQGGSGTTSYGEFSPMAGLVWSPGPAVSVYANVSTGFDAPAITELANPEGATGFNRDLGPQQATSHELGLRGVLADRVRYELAAFRIDVEDELVPFELAGSGQSFFRNAGSSSHDGVEASLQAELLPGLTASATYTWSDFTFDEFSAADGTVYDGNRIPGVPEHLFHAELDWRHASGFFAGADVLLAGRFFADNANTVENDRYTVANVRAGWRWSGERWQLEPFVGISNVGDEKYNGNVRLNASFGRYWEPAPERNVYGGLEIRTAF
ncbi:TonB-dependent receptor family protein [Elongatibacter sediminis]|uniref:TonB-dependent receptor n=1 Tax=Elongatibacter sediminis TaxID=3119006 RepID=A0AAW9RN41_9GAMM